MAKILGAWVNSLLSCHCAIHCMLNFCFYLVIGESMDIFLQYLLVSSSWVDSCSSISHPTPKNNHPIRHQFSLYLSDLPSTRNGVEQPHTAEAPYPFMGSLWPYTFWWLQYWKGEGHIQARDEKSVLPTIHWRKPIGNWGRSAWWILMNWEGQRWRN